MKHNQQLKYSTILIIFIITGLLLTACGGAQTKTFKVGALVNAPTTQAYFDGFKAGLAELGYVEGKNLTYIYDGPVSEDASASAAQNLLKQEVDLIFAVGEPATLQAQKVVAGTNLPIIFAPLQDPQKLGVVKSIAAPGGNITGVQLGKSIGKRLEWLIKVAPATKQVLVLHDPAVISVWMEDFKQNAPALGIELVVREVRSKEELIATLADIPEEVDAIFPLPDALLFTNMDLIMNAAIEHKLPLTVTNSAEVEKGALLAFGTDRQAVGKQAAEMANQVFKGVSPGELPVETAEYYLSINLKTAQAIGLDIPDAILRQADIVIR